MERFAAWGNSIAVLAVSLLVLLGCVPVYAIDGTVQINQERALAGGVTTGDQPGFPVTIGASGSYVVTSDLVVPLPAEGASASAIQIDANFVTIDLNGFSVHGDVDCEGGPVESCSTQLPGAAISSARHNVTVRNGFVIRLPTSGVQLGDNARVENLIVTGNAGSGVVAGQGCLIRGVSALGNLGAGISGGANCMITQNIAVDNVDGIRLNGNSTVRANVTFRNRLEGIAGAAGSQHTVIENTAVFNGRFGMAFPSKKTGLSRNVLAGNGEPAQLLNGTQMQANICGVIVCP